MSFGILTDPLKRTVRGPDNPMDRCTVISIYPREVDETKCTITPSRYFIPPGSYDHPTSLLVGSASWWKDVGEDSPLLEITNSSIQVADSVVKDYCNGILGCDMGECMPGLFYLPGSVDNTLLLSKYKPVLDRAKRRQDNWYRSLVKMADSLWSRSQGNPLAIDDTMRLAAKELGLNTKEWIAGFEVVEMVRCVSCGAMRNPAFPMCQHCRTIIDKKRFAELGLEVMK